MLFRHTHQDTLAHDKRRSVRELTKVMFFSEVGGQTLGGRALVDDQRNATQIYATDATRNYVNQQCCKRHFLGKSPAIRVLTVIVIKITLFTAPTDAWRTFDRFVSCTILYLGSHRIGLLVCVADVPTVERTRGGAALPTGSGLAIYQCVFPP